MVYFLIISVVYLFLQASYIRKIQEIPIVWRLKKVFSFLATINSLMIYILVLFLDCVAVSCFILFLFFSLGKKVYFIHYLVWWANYEKTWCSTRKLEEKTPDESNFINDVN